MNMFLYVDDVRNPPKDGNPWVIARDVDTAEHILMDNWDRISYISFDHDMGADSESGYALITWIEHQIRVAKYSNHFTMVVHSANPVGAKRIQQVIDKLMEA